MSDLFAADLQAEQAVLGSMLIDAECIRDVLPKLREDDFFTETDRLIWRTIRAMEHERVPIDALTVIPRIGETNEHRRYLAELLENTPTSANVLEYAEIVSEGGKRRRLRTALSEAIEAIDERRPDDEVFPHVEAAIAAYDERTRGGILSPQEQTDAFYTYRAMLESGVLPFTKTGYHSLDEMLGGGLKHGSLYYLAARPGTGKTAFALNIGDYVAANVGKVLFVSMEMSNVEIMSRRYAMATSLDSRKLLMQPMNSAEYDQLADATNAISTVPFHIVAEGAKTAEQVCSLARSMRGLKLLIIDHFTLFSRPHRQQDFSEYAEISHRLANLANKLSIPILCLIQVNRDDSQGKKKRARLDTLRGSGATEEDAAGVLFIEHAADVDQSTGQPREELVVLEKNRFGPTGKIRMSYRPRFNTFAEIIDGKSLAQKFSAEGRAAKDRARAAARQIRFDEITGEEEMPF